MVRQRSACSGACGDDGTCAAGAAACGTRRRSKSRRSLAPSASSTPRGGAASTTRNHHALIVASLVPCASTPRCHPRLQLLPRQAPGCAPPQEQTLFRIFYHADKVYCLTVRHDVVVLAPTNPRDEFQGCSPSLGLSHQSILLVILVAQF